MSNGGHPVTQPATSGQPQSPPPQVINVAGSLVGGSSLSAAPVVSRPVRIAKIILRDFRAFPNNPDNYQFDLGQDGKNLLLFGENGSGKSSLFHALRLLLNDQQPPKPYEEYRHVFTKGKEGTVTVVLTAGQVPDYIWSAGAGHPTTHGGGQPFLEFVHRTTFLDYKSLLQTSLPYEHATCVDIFDLVVNSLLKNTTITGQRKPVSDEWKDLLAFQALPVPVRGFDEPDDEYRETIKDWPSPEQQKRDAVDGFWKLLNDFLAGITARANRYLADYLQPNLSIELKPDPPDQQDSESRRKLLLTARYAKHEVPHPAQFLNEARLSAIAISLYLAAVIETKPAGTATSILSGTAAAASHPGRLLVLDDPLLGLDLSHRLPLLDLLQSPDFAEWQILLLTFDAHWFDMATEQLRNTAWVTAKLHAKAHEQGWEVPLLESKCSFLEIAWKHIQNGDFKAAAVYLRTAWEHSMRTFCEARNLKFPLKRSPYDYKAEEFWNVVKSYEFKPNCKLVDDALAGEIKMCQDYVLNPLCHNDPARPTREEVRRTHGALKRLTDVLDQDVAWRRRVGKGKSPSTDFTLALAGELLNETPPPCTVIAPLLRNAFDHALWRFCAKKAINFTSTCSQPLTTASLWHEATNGAGGLAAAQAAFVAAINAHADLMLADSPDLAVLTSKSQADLQALFATLRGNTPAKAPRMIMDAW